MIKHLKASQLVKLFAVFALLTVTSARAEKNPFEKKGTFGFEYYGNFVTMSYVVTYLGESYKPGNLAFQIDLDDNKGFDLSREVVESECALKDARNHKVPGTVERVSDTSVKILFPYDEGFKADGRVKLYTLIRDYKLLKTFKETPSSVAIK